MCGIAGYIGPKAIPADRIRFCLDAMKRRGPDDQSSYLRELEDGTQVVLLHSRLQIIDLDPRSNQPFRHGNHILCFNGELYNYKEVRKSLERDQAGVQTPGDTAVLAALLAHQGAEALRQCDGMWAFSLFDERQGVLTLCRDRFGEKPLYVMEVDDGLYFGSEIKFLSILRGKSLEVNEEHLYRYLVNGYKSLCKGDETFFRAVRKLPAGSLLEKRAGQRSVQRRYWSPSYCPDESMTYEEAVQGVRKHLLDSVRLRLRSDVPLAFCLSGGVDSNALVASARQSHNTDVHTFTLVNEDERYDERDQVASVVRQLGLAHTMVPISSKGFRDRLPELVRYHDAPLYTVTSYVQWLLFEQVASKGYRVVLTGLGADELLSGYYDHHNLYLHAMYGTKDYEPSKLGWREYVAPIVRNPYLRNPDLFVEDAKFRDHIFLNNRMFAACLTQDFFEAFHEKNYSNSLMRNRMLNELRHETVPAILHEDDLNAMFFSIENRAPFLSPSLCDFCNSIPTRHLMQESRTKAPLRDAMVGMVPDSILNCRTKVGFNAPITSLLDLGDPDTRAWMLDDGPIFEHVQRDRIERLLTTGQVANSMSKFLFNFVCSKVFLEQQCSNGV